MKPWEETWSAAGSQLVTGPHATEWTSPVFQPEGRTELLHESSAPSQVLARVRLAAAAPEMARMLVELQSVDTSDGEYTPRCPVCQNCTRTPDDFVWHHPNHAPDCRLIAVLTKAEVLA